MDFSYSPDDLAFAKELRAWVDRELPADWRTRFERGSEAWVQFLKDWERNLYRGGWAGIHWPREYGGMDAPPSQKVLYTKVMAEAGAPEGAGEVLGKLGKRLLGPILMQYGTAAQKERFLPRILRGEEFWCQGFSEPEAGSDLASLKTRAVLEGDHFVVDGQKVWTSQAPYCDWCFVLVRTDPDAPKHDGISMLLIDLDSPGIDIRPIRQINGRAEFCEIFYDAVRVPQENLVGPLNRGWDVAKSLLAFERGVESALARYVDARAGYEMALRDVSTMSPEARASRSQAYGLMQAEIMAIELNALRLLSDQMQGGRPGFGGSIVKMQSTESWGAATVQQLKTVPVESTAEPGDPGGLTPYVEAYLTSRALTIAAGSSEVQRNIIAKRVLGLGRTQGSAR